MSVIETFGKYVTDLSDKNPDRARKLLTAGFRANGWKHAIAPGKDTKGDQMVFDVMNRSMVNSLARPDKNAMVSLFTPCDPLHVLGLQPYCCEAYSNYLSGSMAEQGFLKKSEAEGLPTSLCSFHKIFIGAAKTGVMPRPKFIINTTLACDANTLTFKHLADFYEVPHFTIDVPYEQSDYAVAYVAGQIRQMCEFIEKHTGSSINETKLKETVARSYHTQELYQEYLTERAGKELLSNMTAELFRTGIMHILLGTKESEACMEQLLKEAKTAPPARGAQLLWIHTTPYWVPPLQKLFDHNPEVQITGSDMCYESPLMGMDPEKPYETMAKRLVYSSFNGPVQRRIDRALETAEQTKADGIVWFCHWGCKHTLGGAQLAKKKMEEAGYPTLILDGDSCDRAFGGEGQAATRMEAFLELLNARKEQVHE